MTFAALIALQMVLAQPDTTEPIGIRFVPPAAPSAGYLALTTDLPPAPTAASADLVPLDTIRPRPRVFVYSDAYATRATIHKWSSWAMLPLFAGEYAVGQQLYNDPQSGSRDLHSLLAAGIGGLFAVNTATGALNLWESRKDPNGRTRRWIHGIAMLVADAGFLATAGTAPESEGGAGITEGNKSLHRTLAISSGSVALGSWLMMLLWRE